MVESRTPPGRDCGLPACTRLGRQRAACPSPRRQAAQTAPSPRWAPWAFQPRAPSLLLCCPGCGPTPDVRPRPPCRPRGLVALTWALADAAT